MGCIKFGPVEIVMECLRGQLLGATTQSARVDGVRSRVNREVQTVKEAGKEGAAETGVKSGLKKAHKP